MTSRVVQGGEQEQIPSEASIAAEGIEQVFLPDNGEQAAAARCGRYRGGDAPETFSGDFIDVGALAEEFFGLAIDPYPRKPGAELSSGKGEQPEVDGPLQRKLRLITGKS